MKNIHILPTSQPSRLVLSNNSILTIIEESNYNFSHIKSVHIYITSDEEIKDVRPHKGKWQLEQEKILNKFPTYLTDLSECKLVIMTTDQDLIKDGVQAIDDEFLEWFVKNPSCESVEVEPSEFLADKVIYEIIIPQEETKQETLEEAAKNTTNKYINEREMQTAFLEFIEGAKWMSERRHSEEEAFNLCRDFAIFAQQKRPSYKKQLEWFEQYKKK
jgi:hypothetical protein